MDFSGADGWSMYHGSVVPGFPQHPHRGFETVTFVRRGLIDHSDSLGATARFGRGDVQWLTAGAGIVHCEMFPLVDTTGPNTTELFQIWLNLPADDKMVEPYFTMLWDEDIPRLALVDDDGRRGELTVIAGAVDGPPAAGRTPGLLRLPARRRPGDLAPGARSVGPLDRCRRPPRPTWCAPSTSSRGRCRWAAPPWTPRPAWLVHPDQPVDGRRRGRAGPRSWCCRAGPSASPSPSTDRS